MGGPAGHRRLCWHRGVRRWRGIGRCGELGTGRAGAIVERRDFDLPACLKEAGAQFAMDNNLVAGWISECVEKAPEILVDRRDVYASFAGWCQMEHGMDTKLISQRAFLPMLRHTGLIQDEKRYSSGAP